MEYFCYSIIIYSICIIAVSNGKQSESLYHCCMHVCATTLIVMHMHIHVLFRSTELYPNVELEGTGIPELTQQRNLFIYTWPPEEQERHPGTVTAIEFCFQMTERTTNTQEPIFSLYLLEQTSNNYRITQTINVAGQNLSSSNCTSRVIDVCCSRKQLQEEERFQVPSSYLKAFAISTDRTEGGILGYRPGQENNTSGFQIPSQNIESNGELQISPEQRQVIHYRMFNFIIGI